MLRNLIVAVDRKGGISKKGIIPWRFKEDSNFFLDVTKRQYVPGEKNAVIMGKNTWKSFPDIARGLKDRINVVVSRTMTNDELISDNKTDSEVYLVKSVTEGLKLCDEIKPGKVFIGGGSEIYKEVIQNHEIDELYITKIDADYDCDNTISLGSILFNYKTHSNNRFYINDIINKKSSFVDFIKMYKNIKPTHYEKNLEEQQYLNLLKTTLDGDVKQTRNSMTYSTFGNILEFDLNKGFPLLTTKKVLFEKAFKELMFFLRGDTNTNHLVDEGVKIWEPNTRRAFLDSNNLSHLEEGDMGGMYGYQWLHYGEPYKGMNIDYTGKGFNQLEYVIDLLKTDPFSRRILMTTFDPSEAHNGCLFPCHGVSIIFNASEIIPHGNMGNSPFAYSLSCMMVQRSLDLCCGFAFNCIQYSLLVHFLCEIINNDVNYKGPHFYPGTLKMVFADTHIYKSHKSEVIRQILREPHQFPELTINRKVTDITDFKLEDISINNYTHYPFLKYQMVA